MTDPSDRAALFALLDFHVEAGVDLALDDTPRDRFADETARKSARAEAARAEPAREGDGASERAPRRAPGGTPASSVPARPGLSPAAAFAGDAAQDARERARNAASLEELEGIVKGFEGCALKVTAKQVAFADGVPGARVMLVGEAPGAEEDRIGKPFMGRSGQLLDRMLAAIGLDRTGVYIANIVPWRPPGNRTPTPQEVAICRPFIERQIELAAPDILICLGGPAAQALLGVKEGITKTRGRWFTYQAGGREIRALATLHPAYLLRQPLNKRYAWRDFRALRKALDEAV
ncbi:uracil-DNA glycosylase [Salinarimonas soli]|uniref:Type-4 uracil-DNA glycosylase n=1 Tax=Salinarimonas soli TaxID=1638099 RepID=A0A5B2VY40_9HYPH|nr:uracil-DNA glycosylase [Salinarimonas soli]KAA2244301.1 uracil-DNA glycosylase [Salinarimonas soli]